MSPFTSLELQSWLIKIDVVIFNLLYLLKIGQTMFNLMLFKLSYYDLQKSSYNERKLSVKTKWTGTKWSSLIPKTKVRKHRP
jgi:hypothetical protein